MSEDHLIPTNTPNFLSRGWTFVMNLIIFVEDENKTAITKLDGDQKYSRFKYFWDLLYKSADFFFDFPDKVDKFVLGLPGLVKFIVDSLHDNGIFTHQEATV